ncbi:hypothetical protein Tco_0262456 [Tanacetum coccineum]
MGAAAYCSQMRGLPLGMRLRVATGFLDRSFRALRGERDVDYGQRGMGSLDLRAGLGFNKTGLAEEGSRPVRFALSIFYQSVYHFTGWHHFIFLPTHAVSRVNSGWTWLLLGGVHYSPDPPLVQNQGSSLVGIGGLRGA